MKQMARIGILLVSLLLSGCATSTVQKRKQERPEAYAQLSPEFQSAVDRGQIKVGMSTNAVYLAWGKPTQTLTGETSTGPLLTWLYYGTQLVEYRFWSSPAYFYGYGYGLHAYPYLGFETYPRPYVCAEVVFENGVVKEWRRLPAPP